MNVPTLLRAGLPKGHINHSEGGLPVVLQKQLKDESEALIRGWGLPVNPNLPLIEADDELQLRTAQEVGTRLFVLGYVIGFYYTDDTESLRQALVRYDLYQHLSRREVGLFHRTVTKQDRINCSWLEEGALALTYCLGLLDMDPFHCVTPALGETVRLWCDPEPTIAALALRPKRDILAAADLYYRLHWAARELGYGYDRLNLSLVVERRRAFDWVLGIEDWDDVPLDT